MTLLTTLIPAYKPEFLGETLLGLRRQSLQDFRVILSDDSPGAVITEMIRDGRFGSLASQLNLTVVRGPGSGRRNHEHLLDLWARQPTPLVHFMLDDDVVFPDFYRAHAQAHADAEAQGSPLGATISQRWLSQDSSLPAWSLPLPEFVSLSPRRAVPVNAEQLFSSTVPGCQNWLGELSNIVFSAAGAALYPRPPAHGLSYYGLLDIGALLTVGSQLPLLYLHDHLSVFRQHAGQTTHQVNHHGGRIGFLVWAAIALHAFAEGRINAAQCGQALAITVQRCLQTFGEADPVVNQFYDLIQHRGADLADLHQAFTAWWLGFLASHPTTQAAAAPAPATAPVTAQPDALQPA